MSFQIDNSADQAMPTDITLRVPLYREPGRIARVRNALVTLVMNYRLRQIARRRYRHPANLTLLPDFLRRDVGLPPAEPRPPSPYEVRW